MLFLKALCFIECRKFEREILSKMTELLRLLIALNCVPQGKVIEGNSLSLAPGGCPGLDHIFYFKTYLRGQNLTMAYVALRDLGPCTLFHYKHLYFCLLCFGYPALGILSPSLGIHDHSRSCLSVEGVQLFQLLFYQGQKLHQM